MPKFVSEKLTPISLDSDPHTVVWIRDRLNLGQVQGVSNAIGMAVNGRGDEAGIPGALWDAYVVKWEGDFYDEGGRFMKCNAANIRRLEPDDPLVEKVSDEIARRWEVQNEKVSPDPNLATTTGSKPAGKES